MNIEDNNAPVETVDTETTEQSLDDFETEFFSGKAPVEKPVEEEPTEEDSSDDEAPEETVEENASDDSDDTEETEEDKAPKKEESRAEKRIRELNAKFREEERKRLELERLLEEKSKSAEKPDNEPTPAVNEDEEKPPHWDDEDENGHKKYPLGQFDPKFNSDLVAFTVRQETRAYEERKAQEEQQRRYEEAQMALQEDWNKKIAAAQERYPDFQEKGQELINSLNDIPPAYGKYLTDTIRSIDNGEEVLYYLASNPDIARDIVNQGAAKATIALGRISAQFDTEAPKKTARTKVTSAPPPPPKAKGSASPRLKNLDDLDDFEEVFFRRK